MGWLSSDGDFEFGGRSPAEAKREEEERRAAERAATRRALERRGVDVDDRVVDIVEGAVRAGICNMRGLAYTFVSAGEFLRSAAPEMAARADAAALAEYIGDRLGADGPFPEPETVQHNRAVILAAWRGAPMPQPPKRRNGGAIKAGRFPRR